MPTSASSSVRKLFDYDSLDTADAVFVQQQTGAIQSLMKRSAQDIVEIGQRLTEIKKRLGHGRFGSWLEAEFNWDERTARRFMSVAEKFSGKTDKLSEINLAPSALYLLATASTPESARKEAISRAQAGESITYSTAKNIKQRYTPPKKEVENPTPQVSPQQSNQIQGQVFLSDLTPPPADKGTAQVNLSPQSSEAFQPTQTEDLQPLGVKDTPPPPLPTSPTSQALSTPAAPPVSSAAPARALEDQRDSAPRPNAQTTYASPQLSLRQRATEQARPRLEIMAIRPKEADPEVSEEDEVETVSSLQKRTPKFVQPGTWWQFGEQHLLYCGDPASPRFRERLPEKIALSLAFPPTPSWQLSSLSSEVRSSLALFTRYQENQDLELFREMIERSLLLYTEGDEAVVFSFLPDPEILMLAHNLECRWFCAEPDALKCEAAIALWRGKGFRAEKLSGLRF